MEPSDLGEGDLRLLAVALEHYADGSRASRVPPGCASLSCLRAPGIALLDYTRRIAALFGCSPVCLHISFAYIERLRCTGVLEPGPLTTHRLFLVGVVIAAKITDDRFYTNRHYARVGGISLASLNAAELAFLKLLDFRGCVTEPEVEAAVTRIEFLGTGGVVSPPASLPDDLSDAAGSEQGSESAESTTDEYRESWLSTASEGPLSVGVTMAEDSPLDATKAPAARAVPAESA